MAAELKREDLFSDDLLTAPAVLTKGLQDLVAQMNILKDTSKQYNDEAQKGKSPKKIAEETEQLTKAQGELAKVQGQIATVVAKSSTEYIKEEAALKKVNEERKLKITLGDKDAKQVNAQTASLAQLGAALNANRKAYADLRSESERNSKEGRELLKTIQTQDVAYKDLRKSIGQNQDNVGNYEGATRDLKNELKAARDEMIGIGKALGTDSKEFQDAAVKAGALKDEIGDLQTSIKNVSGSKLENLSASFGDVFSKLKSGDFTGALEGARQFATVSKSITFADAGKSLKELGTTLLTVGRAILTNPLFLIPAIIIGISVALYKLRDSIPFVSEAFKAVGDTIGYVTGKVKEFLDWTGLTTFAQDEAAENTVKNANKQIEATKRYYDQSIKLATANAEDVTRLEKEKWNEIIKLASAGASAAFEQGKSLEEQSDEYKKFIEELGDANIELAAIVIKQEREKREELAKLNKERDAFLKSLKEQEEIENRQRNQKATEGIIKAYNDLQNKILETHAIQFDADKESTEDEDRRLADDIRKRHEAEAKKQQLIQTTFQFAQNLLNEYANNLRQQNQEELSGLEEKRDYELQLAGDNKDAKDAINKEYNAKQKALQKEQAQRDKELAVLGIVLHTAQGITAALASVPPNVPLSIAIGIIGAVQLATAKGVKLPAFEKGTLSAPGGLALVGEAGSELVFSPSGKASLTPDGPSLMNLAAGSQVIPHEETLRMLAARSIRDGRVDVEPVNAYDFSRLEREIAELKHIMKTKKETHINITRQGMEQMIKNAETRTYFMDKVYR